MCLSLDGATEAAAATDKITHNNFTTVVLLLIKGTQNFPLSQVSYFMHKHISIGNGHYNYQEPPPLLTIYFTKFLFKSLAETICVIATATTVLTFFVREMK